MMDRRNFIGKTAVGAAAITVIPRHVLGGKGFVAANDKINVGFIGTGKQARSLLNFFTESCEEIVPVAACDVYKAKLDQFVAQAKNLQNKNRIPKVELQTTDYYRDILNNDEIDAVVIATPDHWHAQIAVDAAKAGKDIYCEKPMALTVAEGRAMVDATRKHNRVFQTGNMQRSWRDFRHAVELVRNGYIGDIKEINVHVGDPVVQCNLPTEEVPEGLNWDMWVGPSLYQEFNSELAPPIERDIFPNWRNYRNFGGGMITDWGAHMFDIAQWGLDMDKSGPVGLIPPEKPAKRGLKLVYGNDVVMNHVDWGESNAVQFVGTDGRIEVSRSFLRTYPDESLAKAELKETDKRVYYSDNHYQDWVKAMKTRTKPISDVETGHRTASVCNIAHIAYELQRPLLWDPKAEKFKGDDFANLMVSRPIRGKWDFTDV